MKILVIGPSETKSRGGMATVLQGIRRSKILNNKYDITIFPSYIDGNIFVRVLYCIYAYIRFLFIYKKYDLFHIHTASFGSTFRKRLYLKKIKKAGKKAIVHIHGAKYLVFYEGLNKKKKEKVIDFLKSADLVLALSDDWKKKFEKTFLLKHCAVLHNGIDTEEFKTALCDVKQYQNSFVFLGRLGERKGAYDLINAVYKVANHSDIHIYMAGDGEISEAKALIKEKGLEGHIEVVGWVDMKGKIDLLEKCATLVLPSYYEGLPMAVLEGMACGKAIISTTVGAIPEVVTEDNGILIKAGDIDSLAEALIQCSTDKEMIARMSQNNIEKINNEYSMKAMHEKLIDYYDKMILH